MFSLLPAQTFNRPVPGDFHPYRFEQSNPYFDGSILTSAAFTNNLGRPYYMALLDGNGYIVWYTEASGDLLDFKYLPGQNQFAFTRKYAWNEMDFYLMNTSFQITDSLKYLATTSTAPDNHEHLVLDNGHRLIFTQETRYMDLSGYTFNGIPGDTNIYVRGNEVLEYDSQANLIFRWSSLDHIPPSEFVDGYLYNPGDFDYAHANSIALDDDGHLLVSFRHLNAIYKIHRQTGAVIWILGGKSSDFTFPNDPQGFSGQHTISKLPNGGYALFDNGNSMTSNRHSRMVEYTLDTSTWTANLVYSYDDNQSHYASAMGSYQHDDPNLRCIGWGFIRRPSPSITLLDGNDDLISQLYFDNFVVTYRAQAYDKVFSLPRPVVSCQSQPGSLTLSGNFGHADYLWSTGATSRSITISDTGTYMLWVPHGIGKVGSVPIHITDIDAGCAVVGAEEPSPLESNPPSRDKIVGYYDLSGQEISAPQTGRVYLIRYESGRTRLIFQ